MLPLELFLHVLDQLVGSRDGTLPVAHAPTSLIAKTLRSLTLVSRDIYPIASRYLYSHCLYLNNCTNYARLRRTLGFNLGYHPQALDSGKPVRNDKLFADTPRYITSAFISPVKSDKDSNAIPLVRLPQLIDLCKTIGPTLKRLALDTQPVYTVHSEVLLVKPYTSNNNIFLHMPNLEELITSFDALDCFPAPPPNLKRLAVTCQDLQSDFFFSISTLETLVFLRPYELLRTDIDSIFEFYKGKSLDIILVDVNSNHRTPTGTRTWGLNDTVRIWEVDVPTSFYGDEDELVLCDNFIWTHGVQGTLWNTSKRRMASWADVQRRLAGPVHLIVDGGAT
ncbi:hypothetical protein EK21DRAFT_114136 [Setomelanomma holmii]|uniref:Uncharacterized protein n=1 Tax=Setomelanomma holmii TaxID=210430 RepID=A0A9P4LKC4_9PLEO|nr:hypothetical protein EK21DRAFT_114136 [Setomelanomma holmii]